MKIAVISDTHRKHSNIEIPENVDCLIHCGDIEAYTKSDLFKFLDWFRSHNIKHKIFIAGNHEKVLKTIDKRWLKRYLKNINVIYLEDEEITIENIKFYGTPWSMGSNTSTYAFSDEEEELKKHFEKIPEDTNILISHQPAHLDLDEIIHKTTKNKKNVGSRVLKEKIKKLKKLKFHFTGHIHEARGVKKGEAYTTVNASSYNRKVDKLHNPIVIEY